MMKLLPCLTVGACRRDDAYLIVVVEGDALRPIESHGSAHDALKAAGILNAHEYANQRDERYLAILRLDQRAATVCNRTPANAFAYEVRRLASDLYDVPPPSAEEMRAMHARGITSPHDAILAIIDNRWVVDNCRAV